MKNFKLNIFLIKDLVMDSMKLILQKREKFFGDNFIINLVEWEWTLGGWMPQNQI